MKILIVIHTIPRHSLGGSEMCAASLAAELGTRHDVVVCAGRPPGAPAQPPREAGPGYVIEWLDTDPSRPPTLDAAYRDTAIDAQFDRVMARHAPDVVHVHGVWGLSNNVPLIARNRGAAVVFTLHDFWLMCPRGQRLRPDDLSQCHAIDLARCSDCLRPWIAPSRRPSLGQISGLLSAARPPIRTILAKAQARVLRAPDWSSAAAHVERYHDKTREVIEAVDLFVSPSQFLATEFVRYGIPADRIAVSDNGIDTARFAACQPKRSTSVVRFGFLGSWMPSKGLHVLLDAFGRLTGNARLIVYGAPPGGDPGDYARSIRSRTTDRRISFAGRVEPEHIAAAFQSIDVLVVPSLWFENAPLTIREAFASRTPVVASRSGGMAECVRDGVDGLLFPTGSAPDLASALRRFVREPALLPTLSRHTPRVKTVVEHAIELERLFLGLLTSKSADHAVAHANLASHS
jgi:glycosyltransferase involved in cell wall biosynthesis